MQLNKWNESLVDERHSSQGAGSVGTGGGGENLTILEQYKKNERQFLNISHAPDRSGNLDSWKPLAVTCQTSPKTGHYVGLTNQGLTCYINSLIQQFFMTPHFRQGLLEAVPDEEKLTALKHGEELSNLLGNLKSVTSNLLYSSFEYYDPKKLIDALSNDPTGFFPLDNPVYEQNDANEFFSILTDRLGTALEKTTRPKLLEDCYGGKLVHQLICRGCPHKSERDEPFFNISLDVQGKKDIQQSLDMYVTGEWLEGDNAYFCDKCQKKRDTLKRCCIKDIPETLILHLKRFELNV